MLPKGWLGPQKYPGQNASTGSEILMGPGDPPQTLVFYEVSALWPPEPPRGPPQDRHGSIQEAPRPPRGAPGKPQDPQGEAAGASQDHPFTHALLAPLS